MVCDGQLFDKPRDMAEAKQHLQFFRGKSHYLYTSYALVQGDEILHQETVIPELIMRDFDDDFLDHYLENSGEKIVSSVGCYLLEERGPQLFDEIKGDYFTILGLPLLKVMGQLRDRGLLRR